MAQRGASMLEVILAIALVLMLVPFMYYHIADMNNTVKDVAMANQIVKLYDPVIDFIRVNNDDFTSEDGSAIPLTSEELAEIAPLAKNGWVFKNDIVGGNTVEIYLLFSFDSAYRTANIAKYIGADAALVSDDNVAYSGDWAVSFDDELTPGDLVFKITHDFSDADNNKFLHRGTIGGAHLNRMERDLNMNLNNLYNVKNITIPNPADCSTDDCCSGDNCGWAYIAGAQAKFLNAGTNTVNVNNAIFSKGAEISSVGEPHIGHLTVAGNVINLGEIDTETLEATSGTLYAQDIILTGNINIGSSLRLGIDQNLHIGDVSALILTAAYVENINDDGVAVIGAPDKGLGEVAITSDRLPTEDNYYDNNGVSFVVGSGSGILKYGLYVSNTDEVIVPPLSVPLDYNLRVSEIDPYAALNKNQFNDIVDNLTM